jgi:RTX calcium-binding nonapeptide repeat (4 copies)/WD40-like Beta Propeller Repeat
MLLAGAVLIGATGARSAAPPALPDFAYAVTVSGFAAKQALCVARDGDVRGGVRLAGLGVFGGVSWAPDGSRVAVALATGDVGAIRLADAGAGVFRAGTKPRATEDDTGPDWSPDGARIAFARYVYFGPRTDYRRMGLWMLDVRRRGERQLSRRFPGSMDWSPSGDRLAVRFDSDLSLYTSVGKRLWTVSRGSEDTGGVAWSPSGDLLAVGFGREVLLLTPERTVVQTIGRPDSGELLKLEGGLSWSPDGQRLAVGGGAVFDRGGRLVGRYAPPSTREAVSFAPRWTPDGTAIVFQRAPARYVSSRYVSTLTHGPSDLYAWRVGALEAFRLTATPAVSEAAVVIRPARAGGTAGKATPCMRQGTPGRDVVFGTADDDLVVAAGGDDVVKGGGGRDLLLGGDGADVLAGGAGRDQLWGEGGRDRLHARDGARDEVRGGPGIDRAWVDRRADIVVGVEKTYRR